MRNLILVLLVLLLIALPSFGASSFLGGFSGNILTPDAVITPAGAWDASFHAFLDVFGNGDLTSFAVQYGVTPAIEVGAAFLNNSENDVALSGKWRLVPETATRPAVVIGAFDAAGTAEFLDEDPGFFAAISKNITRFASEVAGEPSRPLRITIGAGTGFYDGFFAGLDWTLQPKLSLMAEFFNGTLGDNDNHFNAGARFAVTDALRVDIGGIGFEDLAIGANYRINF